MDLFGKLASDPYPRRTSARWARIHLRYGSALRATGTFIYDVWDPKQGLGSAAHLTLPNTTETDFFCNAQLVLPRSGDLFMAGGDIWNGMRTIHRGNPDSAFFNPGSNTIAAGASMKRPRYYATVTTLPNGRTYIQGGRDGEDRPEIRETDGSFRLLTGINTTGLFYYYPRAWVTPSGRLFGYSDRQMYCIVQPDANKTGKLTLLSAFLRAAEWRQLQRGDVRARKDPACRRRDQRQSGHGGREEDRGGDRHRRATPIVRDATSMPLPLHWHNATVIADGRVVVTGGSAKSNLLTGASKKALIWIRPPAMWKCPALPARVAARLYHFDALLLSRRVRPGRRRGRAGTGGERKCRDLLSALPVPGLAGASPSGRQGGTKGDCPLGKRFALTVDRSGCGQGGDADQGRIGDAQPQHGAAPPEAPVHDRRRQAVGPGARPGAALAPPGSTCCSCSTASACLGRPHRFALTLHCQRSRSVSAAFADDKSIRGRCERCRFTWFWMLEYVVGLPRVTQEHIVAKPLRGRSARLARRPARAGLGQVQSGGGDPLRLRHWPGTVPILEDGWLELDTNVNEQAIRPITLGRKNSLFAGSEAKPTIGRSWRAWWRPRS